MDRKNIKIIIGANAGDEGKGLAVDYFSSQHDHGIVVLTNGGSQRAHTVERPDGTRHVFQHFGSGTLNGWDTYFSKDFILNPMQFCKEYDELISSFETDFRIYCDPGCMWSTPYDMIYNQIISIISMKHNTCGMGIWDTIQRYKYCEYTGIEAYELCKIASPYFGTDNRWKYLCWIRNYYDEKIKKLVKNPECDPLISSLYSAFKSPHLMSRFNIDILKMNQILMFRYCMPLFLYDNIIFENGQGLLLDMDTDIIYGTPSYTGVKTAKDFINKTFKNSGANVEVCYVTRSYLTRHGDGDLSDEVNKDVINQFMVDKTNCENNFQGSLRFGKLYPNDLTSRIDKDWSCIYSNPALDFNTYTKSIMVTHLNECNLPFAEIKDRFHNIYTSDTKYAKDVRLYQKKNNE